MTLWQELKEHMLKHPESTICEGNTTMTYEELCIYAETLSASLSESYYGILCQSDLASIMGLLACIAAEKTAIPMPTRYGKEVYLKILKKAQPPALITDLLGELSITKTNFNKKLKSPEPPAVILFTSGSTGEPKGVMLSEKNLMTNIHDILAYLPITNKDTFLISRPIYHASVLTGELFVSLYSGADIVLHPDAFQPAALLDIIKRKQITALGSTPTLLASLARFIRAGYAHQVKTISVSGECMTEGMAKNIRAGFPKAQIFCGYGLTEASPRVAYLPADRFDDIPIAAGYQVPSIKFRVVNENDENIRDGEIGELLIQGNSIMIGYFDNPTHTKLVTKGGWLHTGDLAYFDHEAILHIVGRKDNMIIRAGMNIYPLEIENIISKDPRTEAVLVYGYAKNGTQEIGMQIIGRFTSQAEVQHLCRAVLPAYQLPSKIELVDHFTMTNSGKRVKR